MVSETRTYGCHRNDWDFVDVKLLYLSTKVHGVTFQNIVT